MPLGAGDTVRRDKTTVFYEGEQFKRDSERQHDNHNEMASPGSNKGANENTTLGQEYNSISASQKMISATWGSALTSLLVTPLDVVRVRLQSQTPVIRAAMPSTSSTAFRELPPNLGVTACCREVFWIGDNAQFCMVGQNFPGNSGVSSSAMSGTTSGSAVAADCAVEETQRKSFTSTVDGLRKIARNEGPLSLWRGLSPTLVMAVPANVIYFTGYDWLRYDRRSPIAQRVDGNSAPLVAGSVARIAAASVISPIEMFRTRLQATSGVGTDHFKATLRGLHQMTQSSGYSSLWRGLTLTMWRDVPFSGLYWWGYEAIRNRLANVRTQTFPGTFHEEDPALSSHNKHYKSRDRPSPNQESNTVVFVESFTAGATSGAIAALITTPFDVAKTRKQVFRQSSDGPSTSNKSLPTTSSSFTASKNGFTSSSFSKLTSLTTSNPVTTTSTSTSLRPEQLTIPRFLLQVFRDEGLSGLFRGWAARCLKVAPACAIMISSYEIGKKMAIQVNENRSFEEMSETNG